MERKIMLSIKEIQKIDYEMVKEFIKICKKYKFKYIKSIKINQNSIHLYTSRTHHL